MKPIEQTDFTKENGNCFASCIASILELPLEQMPNHHELDWQMKWCKWLRPKGLALLTTSLPDNIEDLSVAERRYYMPGYCILAAQSPRLDCLHAVVCLDGVIVHDPHPRREMGVGQWKFVDLLLPLDAKDFYRENTLTCRTTSISNAVQSA